MLPIPAQSIQLSKFVLDPIRVHASESQPGKLLEPPPQAPLPIDYADTKGCVVFFFFKGRESRRQKFDPTQEDAAIVLYSSHVPAFIKLV